MKRSVFNLSHEKLSTFNLGELVPLTIMDVSPGDMFRQNTSMLLRTQPLLAPVMHKVDVSIHHWFVPLRLLWDEFEDFINGGLDGTQDPTFPTIDFASGVAESTLGDYFGLPTGVNNLSVSALPYRAYSFIFNQWYRDQQLQTELAMSTASGLDSTTNTDLKKGCWGKDYFTSARPEPQLGSEVTIPLTGDAPVNLNPTTGVLPLIKRASDHTNNSGSNGLGYNGSAQFTNDGGTQQVFDPNGTLQADLSNVSAVDINQLRLASALQRFKEKMNNFGARYNEFLVSMFNVRPQDARMQIPEYLGGGKTTVQFSEVLQTSEGTDPVGEMRGHGLAAGSTNKYRFMAPEHGFILTMAVVRPKTVYTDGQSRLWNRRSRYDYLLPDFAHLGDQEVLNKELYAAHTTPDGTFGFTPRYDDYRTMPNTVAGEFRSTLNYWHLARNFTSDPALNADFVECNPSDRIFATSEAQLMTRAIHSIKAKRPLPVNASPRLY
jgi:hypothetical protein